MYSNRMVQFLKFYDFCGFNTRHSTSLKYFWKIRIIYFIHFFIVSTSFLLVFYILSIFKLSLQPLELLNEFSVYLFSLFTYCLILIESYVHEGSQRNFWKIYENIYYEFNKRNTIKWRIYLFKIIFCFVSYSSIEIFVIVKGEFVPIVFIVHSYLCKIS